MKICSEHQTIIQSHTTKYGPMDQPFNRQQQITTHSIKSLINRTEENEVPSFHSNYPYMSWWPNGWICVKNWTERRGLQKIFKKTDIKLWSERIWHHCTYVNLILYISINTIWALGTWNWGHSILDTVNATWYATHYLFLFFVFDARKKLQQSIEMQSDLLTTLIAINFRSETSRPQEK